jgi:hypothetical protein
MEDCVMGYTPTDHLVPEWEKAGKVHDWRNYISDEVRALWETFTPEQCAALARQAEQMASHEIWQ